MPYRAAGSPSTHAMVCALYLLTAGSGRADPPASSPGLAVEMARAVTIEVTATRQDGRLKTHTFGAGFVIHPSGLAVTCIHVVPEGCALTVRLPDHRMVPARVVARYADIDTAILRFPTGRLEPAIEVEAAPVSRNTRAVVAGVPERGKRSLRNAEVIALTDSVRFAKVARGTELLRFGASISLGFSGGPLISLDGRFLGMVVARDSSGRSVGYAIPASTLLEALQVPRLAGYWPAEPANAEEVSPVAAPFSDSLAGMAWADRECRAETLSEECSVAPLASRFGGDGRVTY